MKKKIKLIVKEDDKGLRADIFINKIENQISRTRIKNLILEGKLKINNKILKNPSKRIKPRDILNLTILLPKKFMWTLIW